MGALLAVNLCLNVAGTQIVDEEAFEHDTVVLDAA